jgi:ABC transport system ATP-binding/permease protein
VVLGLDGRGGVERFADYSQWEEWLSESDEKAAAGDAKPATPAKKAPAPVLDTAARKRAADAAARVAVKLEKKIAEAEAVLAAKRAVVEDPAIASDAPKLHTAYEEMQKAQAAVDSLYAKWAELEKK